MNRTNLGANVCKLTVTSIVAGLGAAAVGVGYRTHTGFDLNCSSAPHPGPWAADECTMGTSSRDDSLVTGWILLAVGAAGLTVAVCQTVRDGWSGGRRRPPILPVSVAPPTLSDDVAQGAHALRVGPLSA